MKTAIITLVFLFAACVVQAQKAAPEVVKAKFKAMFANAEKSKFSPEKDGSWEVDFKQAKIKSSAKFSATGEWLETEQDMPFAEAPKAVQDFVKSKYAGFEVEDCEKVQTAERICYEISVEKGKQEFELVISTDGKLLEEKKKK